VALDLDAEAWLVPDLSLLRGPRDITPAWLSMAMGVGVAGVEVGDLGAFGVCGRLFRVRTAYAEPGTGRATLVAKLALTDAVTSSQQDALGIYRCEAELHR
jgi:hypothetical protein